MATARVEPIPQEPPPRKVILELSEDEASAVRAIAGRVAGPTTTPLRLALQSVYVELARLFPEDPDEYYKVVTGNMTATSHPLPRLK